MRTTSRCYPLDVAAHIDPRTIDRRVLADHAYERLRGMILDRVIEPESWMPIDVLARDLGVSQTPIREALARLESDGLVAKQDNGRYRTEPLLTRTSFDHLYDVRLQLEPFAAGEASKRIGAAELADLKRVERAMHGAPTGGVAAQFAEFTAANAAFHEIIARGAGNRFLFDAIDRLHSHFRLAQLYLHHGIVDAAPALREHAEIVEAIAARDATRATTLMRHHIERSRHELEGLIAGS